LRYYAHWVKRPCVSLINPRKFPEYNYTVSSLLRTRCRLQTSTRSTFSERERGTGLYYAYINKLAVWDESGQEIKTLN